MSEEEALKREIGPAATDAHAADTGTEAALAEAPKNGFDLKGYLETAARLAAIVSAVFYATGLIIVNVHLSQYGYFSLSLLSTHYLSAGGWAFIPLLVSWIYMRYVVDGTKIKKWIVGIGKKYDELGSKLNTLEWTGVTGVAATTLARKVWKLVSWLLVGVLCLFVGVYWLLVIGIGFLALYTPFKVLLSSDPEFGKGMDLYERLVSMVAVGSLAVFSPVEVTRTLRKTRIKKIGEIIPFLKAENPAVAVFYFVIYVLTFARFLYPEIPSHLGGGRPEEVQLIVSYVDQQDLIAAGLRFPENSTQSERIKLLLATPESYLLLPVSKRTAIGVRRDLVRVVIYESNR